MDATLVYVIMVALGLLMAVLPFGVFMGVSTLLGRGSGDSAVLLTYFLASLAIGYLAALGAYALIRSEERRVGKEC
jgi:membrane-associated PAP2 superfamily phosphatase